MRIGAHLLATDPVSRIVDTAAAHGRRGLDSVWTNDHPGGWDPLTVLGGVGGAGPRELGTAVVATYPTHPAALAARALSAQELTGGRLVLGIGPSHEWFVRGRLGIPYASPAAHTREYLQVLHPLLRGEHVRHAGRFFDVDTGHDPELGRTAPPPPVLLAATGPRMLEVARDLADGIVATWVRPSLVADWLVPRTAPGARVVVLSQIALTTDPDGARERLAGRFGAVADMPAYRAVLDRAGLDGPADTLVAGDEAHVLGALRRYREAGVTDLIVSPQGAPEDRQRVLDLVASVRARHRRCPGAPARDGADRAGGVPGGGGRAGVLP